MEWLFKSSVKSAAAAKTRETLFNLSIHVGGEARWNIHNGSFLYILTFRLRNSEKLNGDI